MLDPRATAHGRVAVQVLEKVGHMLASMTIRPPRIVVWTDGDDDPEDQDVVVKR